MLLQNSLKYMGDENPSPKIKIEAFETQNGVDIRIQDNGIGFDPRYKSVIIKPYTKLSISQHQKPSEAFRNRDRIEFPLESIAPLTDSMLELNVASS